MMGIKPSLCSAVVGKIKVIKRSKLFGIQHFFGLWPEGRQHHVSAGFRRFP